MLNVLRRITFPLLLTAFATTGFVACDDDHDHDEHSDETPADDACEHLEGGPAVSRTAETTIAATAPATADISGEHQRVDLALADLGGGMYGGAVIYAADEAGEFIVFMDTAAGLTVTDAAGQAVAAEATGTTESACTDIQASATFDFEVGTYTLTIAPTTAQMLSLVVVHAGDEHEHE